MSSSVSPGRVRWRLLRREGVAAPYASRLNASYLLVCTLKRSPEPSNAESLAEVVLTALRAEGVEVDVIRLVDHQIDFGVVSEPISESDEWPAIRERILAAEILVMAIPTWLGQPSSVSKVALERMDAFLSETREDGKTPIAYNRVAGVVVVGNEDGAHHVIAETNGALNDIGYSLPSQNWTYWNKGPGPGEEEWLTTEERDWSVSTGKTAASNLLALARALASLPIPPPPGS
jgi:multimeric flavodoxin WrbA